ALIGYLVWPSWEGESAQQKLARLFESQAAFAALLLRSFARPGPPDNAAIQAAAGAPRRARTNAEASADRLADEPPQPPLTARLAYGLTGIGRRLAHASLTLHAALDSPHPRSAPADPPPGPAGNGADPVPGAPEAAPRRGARPPAHPAAARRHAPTARASVHR